MWWKSIRDPKSRNITPSVFFICLIECYLFFFLIIYNYLSLLKEGISYSTNFTLSIWVYLNIHKKIIFNKFTNNFSTKITICTIQMKKTVPKISRWIEKLTKKICFLENPTTHTLLSKVPKITIILVLHWFFKTNCLKGNSFSISE